MSKISSSEIAELNVEGRTSTLEHAWWQPIEAHRCKDPGCVVWHAGTIAIALSDANEMRCQLAVTEVYGPEGMFRRSADLMLTKPQLAELIADLSACLETMP